MRFRSRQAPASSITESAEIFQNGDWVADALLDVAAAHQAVEAGQAQLAAVGTSPVSFHGVIFFIF